MPLVFFGSITHSTEKCRFLDALAERLDRSIYYVDDETLLKICWENGFKLCTFSSLMKTIFFLTFTLTTVNLKKETIGHIPA